MVLGVVFLQAPDGLLAAPQGGAAAEVPREGAGSGEQGIRHEGHAEGVAKERVIVLKAKHGRKARAEFVEEEAKERLRAAADRGRVPKARDVPVDEASLPPLGLADRGVREEVVGSLRTKNCHRRAPSLA